LEYVEFLLFVWIIVSDRYYSAQDATALGSLMQGRGTPEEERLKELMLADLAYVHAKDGIDIKFLREQFQDMFAWDWTHHPYSMGMLLSNTANAGI
jgi:hypothetical protein